MTLRQTITHLRTRPEDSWYYVQGMVRYSLYTHLPCLVRPHIRQQYEWRKVQAAPCYQRGSCCCCGCRTPELFFASKACSAGSPDYKHCNPKPCYPRMMGRTAWLIYKQEYFKQYP